MCLVVNVIIVLSDFACVYVPHASEVSHPSRFEHVQDMTVKIVKEGIVSHPSRFERV